MLRKILSSFRKKMEQSMLELGTLLVKLTHLLVSLKQILVTTNITHDLELNPNEIGANIRELEVCYS
ncbi:hypothetical protein [Bacillus sp. ISL-57]|uniref:hypothetical protein n=2 Tax=Bacillus TaxID=1386 RepID=UPI001BEBFEE8|nr:hypothetical protein [Bacillus sp. ISL-57]